MNYEEKYNEILEWARKNKARLNGVPIEEVLPELRESEEKKMTREEAIRILASSCIPGSKQTEALETLIPELADSDDERIRKQLIDAIKIGRSNSGISFTEEAASRYIAWLEKQKAKEKQDRMMPVYNDRDSFESALDKAWKSYNESGARTVDGCEDDYVECAHAKGFREGYLFGIEKQKEQKHILKFKVGDKVHLEGDDVNILTITGIEKDRYLTDCAYGPILFGTEDIWEIVKQKPAEVDESTKRLNDNWMKQHFDDYKERKPAESISQLTVQGKGVYKICPRCKERMVRDDSMVYTSMPPQYRYECPKCGESECDTVMYDNPETDEQKPAEWSEEDENMRESAIALIRKWTNYSGENVGDSIKVISWLQWLPLLAHQH